MPYIKNAKQFVFTSAHIFLWGSKNSYFDILNTTPKYKLLKYPLLKNMWFLSPFGLYPSPAQISFSYRFDDKFKKPHGCVVEGKRVDNTTAFSQLYKLSKTY